MLSSVGFMHSYKNHITHVNKITYNILVKMIKNMVHAAMIQYTSVKHVIFVHFCKLQNILEVGICIHFLHITDQYFITEDIVSLL